VLLQSQKSPTIGRVVELNQIVLSDTNLAKELVSPAEKVLWFFCAVFEESVLFLTAQIDLKTSAQQSSNTKILLGCNVSIWLSMPVNCLKYFTLFLPI